VRSVKNYACFIRIPITFIKAIHTITPINLHCNGQSLGEAGSKEVCPGAKKGLELLEGPRQHQQT